jgi:hypothetical protein
VEAAAPRITEDELIERLMREFDAVEIPPEES